MDFRIDIRDTNTPEKYIVLPTVSSENRKYLNLNSDVIPKNRIQAIHDAMLYHSGRPGRL